MLQILKLFKNFWPQFLIAGIVFGFFIRLYFPPSFFYTPSFDLSDIVHGNLPAEFELSRHLKKFELPLWASGEGQGFASVAEGYGAFFIPNLIIFFIFPFDVALPTIYVVTFLICALGMYHLLKMLLADKYSSIFGAISFTFSAAMILRVQHVTVLQPISTFPWVVLFFIKFIKSPNLAGGLVLSFALSQLFLAGHVQFFVYSVIILFILASCYWLFKSDHEVKVSFLDLVMILVFSLMLSMIQFLPSIELQRQSYRSSVVNASTILSDFPLKMLDFLTYFSPFISGNVANGTYNSLDWSKVSVYQERTAYIGVLPLLALIYGLAHILRRRQGNDFFLLAIVLFVSVFLSLGKFSPLYFLYIFPPLNMFRVPARFMIYTQMIAAVIAAYGLKEIVGKLPVSRRQVIYFAAITLVTIDLFLNWWNFNPTAKFKDWLKAPQTSRVLDLENGNYRINTLKSGAQWNQVFLKDGWVNQERYYRFFLNSLSANSNLLFGIDSFSGYEVLGTKRFGLQQFIAANGIKSDDNKILLSGKAKQIYDVNGVKYLISAQLLKGDNYREIFKTSEGKFAYWVYQSNSPKKRASLYWDYYKINSLDDYFSAIENVDLYSKVIVEKDIGKLEQGQGLVTITKSEDDRVSLDVDTSKKALMVLADSYYSGWVAKVDLVRTEILPANINSRAIIVPEGRHKVEFVYRPKSFEVGALISGASLAVWLLLWFRPKILDFRKERLFKDS